MWRSPNKSHVATADGRNKGGKLLKLTFPEFERMGCGLLQSRLECIRGIGEGTKPN
jgi:hypothetical protein